MGDRDHLILVLREAGEIRRGHKKFYERNLPLALSALNDRGAKEVEQYIELASKHGCPNVVNTICNTKSYEDAMVAIASAEVCGLAADFGKPLDWSHEGTVYWGFSRRLIGEHNLTSSCLSRLDSLAKTEHELILEMPNFTAARPARLWWAGQRGLLDPTYVANLAARWQANQDSFRQQKESGDSTLTVSAALRSYAAMHLLLGVLDN